LRLHTASEVISLARRLENESADFYDGLRRDADDEGIWRGFALENRRNIAQVERAYYSVISDAIEGGFAFDMEDGDYGLDFTAPTMGAGAALEKAVRTEETIARFYGTAAAQSQSLLADIPRLFNTIAQKRAARVQLMRSTGKPARE
jgi:hypothetical protein